jgi:secreted trypsin-like serine protease
LLIVFAVISLVIAEEEIHRGGRIIGGTEAARNQFPFMAALLSRGHDSVTRLFSGFLITQRTVLTSASILELSASIQVILGAHDWTTVEANQVRFTIAQSEFRRHPDFVRGPGFNNIGLIRLPSAVTLNQFIRTIAIATNPSELFTGSAVTTAGWGGTAQNIANSNTLRFTTSTVISNTECQIAGFEHIIQPTNICWSMRAIRGPCGFDEGGPMFITRNGVPFAIGLMSRLISNSCQNGDPAVFMRLSHYNDFITANRI